MRGCFKKKSVIRLRRTDSGRTFKIVEAGAEAAVGARIDASARAGARATGDTAEPAAVLGWI